MTITRTEGQRIKGQEVAVTITVDNALQATLTDIQSFDAELMLQTKSVGYLGMKTDLKDDVFNGVKFDMSLHIHSNQWFIFANAVKTRSQRFTPDTVITITGSFVFPNGDTVNFIIPDAHFGPIPLNIPSRDDYVSVKLSGEAEDIVLDGV